MAASDAHHARSVALDAAGDYDGAINELALGTQKGDMLCTRQLGLRLLLGDRAPLLPAEGLRFLGDACDGGIPEAAARAAGVIALGARTPPNWQLALAWLARSAAGGWEPARQQLLALCDDRALAERSAKDVNPDWRALVAAVRLEAWRQAPPPNVRSEAPRVVAFQDFARPEICDVLIALADGRLKPALVYDPVAREDVVVAAHRSNTVASFDLTSVEFVHALLQARMAAACGIPETMMEGPTVLHYEQGQQIANHYDFVDPNTTLDYAGEIERNGQRVITFLVYLNDDYEGGETDFPKLGFSHKGRKGDALYFVNALPDMSPDMRTQHAGRPPRNGEKWLVTQFIRSRATR